MSTPPFVIFVTLLLTFTCIDFRVPILRTRLFLRVHSISYPTHDPERTSSKPFTRLIGLRHVTKSGWQNVLLTFSSFKKPRHLKIIYIQNRSDGLQKVKAQYTVQEENLTVIFAFVRDVMFACNWIFPAVKNPCLRASSNSLKNQRINPEYPCHLNIRFDFLLCTRNLISFMYYSSSNVTLVGRFSINSC